MNELCLHLDDMLDAYRFVQRLFQSYDRSSWLPIPDKRFFRVLVHVQHGIHGVLREEEMPHTLEIRGELGRAYMAARGIPSSFFPADHYHLHGGVYDSPGAPPDDVVRHQDRPGMSHGYGFRWYADNPLQYWSCWELV